MVNGRIIDPAQISRIQVACSVEPFESLISRAEAEYADCPVLPGEGLVEAIAFAYCEDVTAMFILDAPGTSQVAEEKYDWATQAELVRAAHQVLGDGALNKGVLSRACTGGEIMVQTGSRYANVPSFLEWLRRKHDASKDEIKQVRNAVIGEIISRNSERNSPK